MEDDTPTALRALHQIEATAQKHATKTLRHRFMILIVALIHGWPLCGGRTARGHRRVCDCRLGTLKQCLSFDQSGVYCCAPLNTPVLMVLF